MADTDIEDFGDSRIAWEVGFARIFVGKAGLVAADGYAEGLHDECQKFSKPSSTGLKAAVKVLGGRVAYPFRQSTIQKLDEDIRKIRANLSFALNVSQLDDTQRL